MSHVWMDGFEGYGNGSTNPSADFARRYSVGDTQYFSIVTGRLGGCARQERERCLLPPDACVDNQRHDDRQSPWLSDGLRNPGLWGFALSTDGDTQGVTLNLTANGELQVLCRATVLQDRPPAWAQLTASGASLN